MANTALVLGGGGITGIAWELGLLAGLAQAGVDLTTADLVVGTSAGAVVAAQVTTGTPLDVLYEAQITGYGAEMPARIGLATILRLAVAAVGRDERTAGARVGAMALATDTVPEERRRAIIAARLPVHEWPERRVLITAVAADTGELAVFHRDSGVSLVDAVAASCAIPGVWPPVSIGGRRYIDGGVRSPANADLAQGQDPVVVLAPVTRALRRSARIEAQLAGLGAVRTAVVSPDGPARSAIGRNVMDLSRRAAAARAGRRQAVDVAPAIADIWSQGG